MRVLAEAKGPTSAPGLDIDTAYGQLLRRMPDAVQERVRYVLVVPYEAASAALRVRAPFGGMKASGIGRELGPEALDGYLEFKSIYTSAAPLDR